MPLGRMLLDTAVFIYAVGTDHSYRAPCRRFQLFADFPTLNACDALHAATAINRRL